MLTKKEGGMYFYGVGLGNGITGIILSVGMNSIIPMLFGLSAGSLLLFIGIWELDK